MMCKVHLFPVLVFLLFQVTFIVCYIAAVLQGHVVPTVPYISDAGTYSPESCLFGQLLNVGAVLLGITVYIRYRQVLELYGHHPEIGAQLLKYNRLSIYFGMISCLGISIVGNFQETNVKFVHFAGAFMCFGFGTLYFWLQACVSYMLQPISGTKTMAHIRLGMAVCCAILFIVQTVTGLISHILYKGLNPRKWYPSDGGWHLHVVSCICEWTVSTLYCFYILTFTDEFREMEIDHPPVTLQPYRVTL